MSIGTGVSAGTGCPQHMELGTHPCFCVPPESRAGSTLDFRVVETGPTFLRLAWQPGPEPPQGYSLSYAVQGEGTVPARVSAPGHRAFVQPHGHRGAWVRVNAGMRAQSAVGVYTPTFTTAAGRRALGVGRACVRRCGGSLCIPTPGGFMRKAQGVC